MEKMDRLDVLIYAHDGRGLGHASRSIGVGLALRRLYPYLKVLFVSGCNLTQELIGSAPLDWLKLPSYETEVIDGKSKGIQGKSLFSDAQLGLFRAKELAHLVFLYRPRLVLVDHTPQGKHKELVAALTATKGTDILWLLGVRGVVGAVQQARSELAGELFKKHYHALLWYGDSSVLGTSHCEQLLEQYGSVPVECGYVLRLSEFTTWNRSLFRQSKRLAGTVSIPWLGEKSMEFLGVLVDVLTKIPKSFGHWRFFVDTDGSKELELRIGRLFERLPGCIVEHPGSNYVTALLHSKIAIIYGGYNSLMDVVHARIPALVILREMQDEEQQIHLRKLQEIAGGALLTVSETKVLSRDLERLLLTLLRNESCPSFVVNTNGAACAAECIAGLLA